MQSGELTVSGSDHLAIALRGFPTKVDVHFKDDMLPVPCNPHHHDELEYEVHSSNLVLGKFVLKIKWRVTSVREIVWRVYY
jgi:hypothetical protein